MAINKRVLIAVFLIAFPLSYIGYGQTYRLRSVDGKFANVEVTANYADNTIGVSHSNNCFLIADFMGLDGKIEVLNEYFLKINYSQRAGVGIKMSKTAFFCISKDMLHESLLLLSNYNEEIVNTYSGTSDSLKLNHKTKKTISYAIDNRDNIAMRIKVHEESTSLNSPNNNYVHNSHDSLQFDKRRSVFYNEKKKIKGTFTIIKPNEEPFKKSLNDTFLAITMRGISYIYVDNEWMELGISNSLLSNLISCNK